MVNGSQTMMAPTLRKFSKTIAGLDEIFIASARLTEKEMTKYAQDLESKFNNKYYDFGTSESDVSKSKALVDIQKDRYGYLVGQKDARLGAILTNYQGDLEGFGEVVGRGIWHVELADQSASGTTDTLPRVALI